MPPAMTRRNLGLGLLLAGAMSYGAGSGGVSSAMQRTAQPPPVAPPTLAIASQRGTASTDVRVDLGLPEGVDTKGYAIEASYWDERAGAWRYPGELPYVSGGRSTSTVVQRRQLEALSPSATRWQFRARMTDPPGPWSQWREFQIEARPARADASDDLQRRVSALSKRLDTLEGTSSFLSIIPACTGTSPRWLEKAGEKIDCAPYTCLPGAGRCRATCSITQGQCLLGFGCVNGACVPKDPKKPPSLVGVN
jgi:hypothetical protein